MGQGYTREIEVLPGMWLAWTERSFHRDWMLKIPVHDHLMQSCIVLSGDIFHEEGYPTLEGQHCKVCSIATLGLD
ncbi:hypothetical protein [Myxacorys almedinensis]|uniref:Uncharacterized protein n=1 Tax=Myxacorys almedinensis A TaxID=2690445 RepID=A0A8J7Z2V5_9CYAN|nr:hypothetical protein [Myxacorys almedinensis]NDJ18989.1 hypothetical protein [Myxacorys almedinensis A]